MPVAIRAAAAAVVLGSVTLLSLGIADIAAFNARAAALERRWQADESTGVAAEQLAPARAGLQAQRDRRVGFLPWSIFSGALFVDPFGAVEALAGNGQAQALARARQRARDDLARLKEVAGPNYDGYQAHASELASARQLADYKRLATAWESEASQLAGVRDQLSRASGGLSDGLPRDVVDGVSRLQSLISAASQAQLSTDPGAQALGRGQAFLALPYSAELEQHAEVTALVRSAADALQHRIDVHAMTNQLLGQLPGLLNQATRYGVTGDLPASATEAAAAARTALSSGDDGRLEAAGATLKQAVDALSSAVTTARQRAAAAALQSGTGCIEGADPKLIVIHLATQLLVAYDKTCPFLRTPVTTGRPALPTDRGTFHILLKEPTHLMHSPWPEGTQYWYPDTWVSNAMEFVSDGTYLHSASWEPASAYGAGSQNGPYASHGCVHVQDGPLAQLYAWAPIGTTVIVTD